MANIEQFEARLRPYKLALVKAFGLDPDTTSSNVSASPTSVTLMQLGGSHEAPAPAIVRGADEDGVVTVEFLAEHWTDEQQQAVENYLAQFPPKFSLGDPDEIREALLASKNRQRLMHVPEETVAIKWVQNLDDLNDPEKLAAEQRAAFEKMTGIRWKL